MKTIIILIGSARKGFTYQCSRHFAELLGPESEIKSEIVFLHNYNLKPCIGCGQCCNKGEQFCPLKDDRDLLLGKIKNSDGFVLATPNYCGQVSGMMKVFLDRFVFLFHRPQYFEKVSTNIVTFAFAAGSGVNKYLNIFEQFLECRVVPGISIRSGETFSDKELQKIDLKIQKHAQNFKKALYSSSIRRPSLMSLFMFHIWRTVRKTQKEDSNYDYQYFKEKGWFISDYYYPVNLGIIKKFFGRIFDGLAKIII